MTPHEKAVNAINHRLERLQANLREAKAESAQRFLFQSLLVTIGFAEALNDYAASVGRYARRRHAELKRSNESLTAEHATLLKSGQELLGKLKANPTDRTLRKEIEVAQRAMEKIQKEVRRGANALQRELAPSVGLVDQIAASLRRLAEADQRDALQRVLGAMITQVAELYAAQPTLTKDLVNAPAWEETAAAEIAGAADFHDAYARTGYQATLALELMILALSETPPATAADATQRANDAAAARIKQITARFSGT